jgi:hypothetical protein
MSQAKRCEREHDEVCLKKKPMRFRHIGQQLLKQHREVQTGLRVISIQQA